MNTIVTPLLLLNVWANVWINVSGLQRMAGKSFEDFAYLVKCRTGRRRGRVSQVSMRLGQKISACPAWMLPTDKSLLPIQPHIAFPKPPKGPGWFGWLVILTNSMID